MSASTTLKKTKNMTKTNTMQVSVPTACAANWRRVAVEEALHGARNAVPAVAIRAVREEADATARPTRR